MESVNKVEKAFDREAGAWGSVSDLEAGSSPPRALVYSCAKWKVAKLYWRWGKLNSVFLLTGSSCSWVKMEICDRLSMSAMDTGNWGIG